MEILGHPSLTGQIEALRYLYKVLKEDCPEFVNAASTAIKNGITKGIEFLFTIIQEVVDVCKQHKELMAHLTKLATKAVVREVANLGAKSIMKYGAKKVASQSAKIAFKYSNPAGLAADIAQCGLEVVGYNKVGKKVGLWGNIATGAATGGMLTGPAWPVGATLGALVGLGTWCIGEGVGHAVEKALS